MREPILGLQGLLRKHAMASILRAHKAGESLNAAIGTAIGVSLEVARHWCAREISRGENAIDVLERLHPIICTHKKFMSAQITAVFSDESDEGEERSQAQ